MPELSSIGLETVALAAVVNSAVMALRAQWSAINGWKTVLLVLGLAAVLCIALAAYQTVPIWKGAVQAVIVFIVSIGGDEYLKRLVSKAAAPA
jgi:hypothetical protein